MKKYRYFLSLLLIAALCLGLTGCGNLSNLGSKQEKADSVPDAAMDCLNAMKMGDFEKASAYMEAGNELLHVFAAMNGESVPEMDKAYQAFCKQMSELQFTIEEEDERLPGFVYIKVKNRDYGSAIYASMEKALDNQAKNGGDAYTKIGDWLEEGITSAQRGEEEETKADFAAKNHGYYLQHGGYPDVEFLNVLTGGFYDFADATMTVCTYEEEGYTLRYDIASIGDNIISYLKTEGLDESLVDASVVDQYKQEQEELCAMLPGFYGSVYTENGMIYTTVGIDFTTADQNTLVQAGIVSGAYNTSFGDYLSLSSTISGFEQDGMTCVTTPEYED